ncbi:MAG: ABC transporter permease [Sphaerochaetaceae bacterium]|jgi:ABC-type lipoprotein release transport system permease subunit
MLTLLTMSFKNIFRYKTRSIITILAIIVSVCISIVIDGLLRGIGDQSTVNLIAYESAEATLFRQGYLEKQAEFPTDLTIDRDELQAIAPILAEQGTPFSPRYKTAVELIYYDPENDIDGYVNAVLVGLDPQLDASVFDLPDSVDEGRWLEMDDEGIVVGASIAKNLNLHIGSFLTLEGKGKAGFVETFDAQVVGIATTGNPAVNMSQVFMTLDALDAYLALDGSVTEIAVSDGKVGVSGLGFADRVQKSLAVVPRLADVEVCDWKTVNADLVAVMNGDKGSSYLILIFLFIIAAAGITNTMIMAVMERRKECAMLRAMGFSRYEVNWLFVLEGAMTGCLGALSGALIGAAVNYPLARYGIDLTSMVSSDMDMGYRVSLIMRSGWYLQSFVGIPSVAVFLAAFSSFIPVARSGRSEIAALMRTA